MTLRDAAALEDIVQYCERIRNYLNRCGDSRDAFARDTMVQDACCMCVVQIGELIGLLSDDTRSAVPEIPWRLIKETRNFYVHNYGNLNKTLTWNTLTSSIPDLCKACKEALEEDKNHSI